MKRVKTPRAEVQCHWCRGVVRLSPYRSPITDVPGGLWVVCGPECELRPDGVIVFDKEAQR